MIIGLQKVDFADGRTVMKHGYNSARADDAFALFLGVAIDKREGVKYNEIDKKYGRETKNSKGKIVGDTWDLD